MTLHFRFNAMIGFGSRIPRWIGENPFFGFLILLFVAALISSVVFYRSVFLAASANEGYQVVETRFDQKAFGEMVQEWEAREERFIQAETLQIQNIVVPRAPSKELTE